MRPSTVEGVDTRDEISDAPEAVSGSSLPAVAPSAARESDVVNSLLVDEVVEQVMRTTGDDSYLPAFLTAQPLTRSAHAALGRLLGDAHCELVAGCPLLAFVTGTPIDPNWRVFCPSAENSLWEHREFLISIYGEPLEASPYESLEWLRHQEDAEFILGDANPS